MQLAQGHHLNVDLALATCIWLLHPAPLLVPKMVLTLCNLHWWFYYKIITPCSYQDKCTICHPLKLYKNLGWTLHKEQHLILTMNAWCLGSARAAHYMPGQLFTLHYIIHYITLPYITLHCIALHYITLHYITLHYITLHYITLHYTTLHYITLHYISLHYITLRYITLHYIALHFTLLCISSTIIL